jgi:YD repeat-containing protein
MDDRRKSVHTTIAVVVFVAALSTSNAIAAVAAANGNYFTGFTDLELPELQGLPKVAVSRTYNSRSQFRGMFGYGWGNDFEAFLIPSADGSVVIQESGGGAKTRFTHLEFNQQELGMLINRIVEARAAKVAQDPQFDRNAYRAKLMSDAYFRDEEARELGRTRELPVGMILYSTAWGTMQSVTKTATGYVREDGGKKEYFEHRGKAFDQGVDSTAMRELRGVYKITKVEYSFASKALTFSYSPQTGWLSKITTPAGSFLEFEYDGDGMVTKVSDERGRKSSYTYCPSVAYSRELRCQRSDLISHSDTSGDVYKYSYDSLHNLTEITSPDQTSQKIEYWGAGAGTYSGAVKTFISERGVRTDYDYWSDPADPMAHYRTTILTSFESGRTYRATHEYWEKRRNDGSTFKYRQVTKTGDEETETLYNECCGQPEKVISNGSVTEYEYYANSKLIKERRSPDETRSWTYSSNFYGKITSVKIVTRGADQTRSTYSYEYDRSAQLARATDSSGRTISFTYDADGRIRTAEDEKRNKLTFEYKSPLGKPTKIALEGFGSISVSYDDRGKIQDVQSDNLESREGRTIAIKIAGMFQALLELIKPAGVSPL